MKLLFLLGSFYPAQNGGPNNSVYWAGKELVSNRSVSVTIASLKNGLSNDHIKKYNIKLDLPTFIEGLEVYFFNYYKNRYLSSTLPTWLCKRIDQFDLVCLTSFFFPWTWFAALICIYKGIPFCIAPRGELEPGALQFQKFLKMVLRRVFIQKILDRAAFVLVTSEQEARYTQNWFRKNIPIELIPNYISLPPAIIKSDDIAAKKNILYLGRIHPKKGIKNLIDAFHLLDEKLSNAQKLIIGGDGDPDYVKSLKASVELSPLRNKIEFLGHVEGWEKEQLYTSARVLVLPSYSENFGNVVVEALSYSIPVICSKYTPWSELDSEGCGYWVDNSPEAIKEALEKILSLKQADYIDMANKGRKFVAENYDVNKHGEYILQIYNKYAR